MTTTNNVHALRAARISALTKPGLLKRFARACWEANQRIYFSAITDPRTGRFDPAVERQVTLMILG
jgi:hypothetical protein